MRDVRFIEAITGTLIDSRRPDGSIHPLALKPLADYPDKELIALRNAYRVLSKGDNLLERVKAAAAETGDKELRVLSKRLNGFFQNDKQLEIGLRGAIHCFSYALHKNNTKQPG